MASDAQTATADPSAGERDGSPVLYESSDGVALLTLNRPDRLNAWSPALESAYVDALDRATEDPDVRVLVVTGAGRGWCAGADMQLLQGLSEGGQRVGGRSRHILEMERAVPKPVIAAINGACAGLGLVHALLCDVRFASAGAKFTTAFSRRGLVAEYGIAWLLPHVTGMSRALDVLLSGRTFLAEEAAQMGLVDHLVEGPVLAAAMDYARDLAASCSPASMSVIKAQVWGAVGGTLTDAVREAERVMPASFERPDFTEGVASYVEKRPPRFEGITAPVE